MLAQLRLSQRQQCQQARAPVVAAELDTPCQDLVDNPLRARLVLAIDKALVLKLSLALLSKLFSTYKSIWLIFSRDC